MRLLYGCIILTLALISVAVVGTSAQQPRQPPPQQQDLLVHARTPLQLYEQAPLLTPIAGRIDHFTADAKRRRVIFSALGNHSVEVFDAFAATIIHSIKDNLDEPQAVLFLDDLDKLWVTNAGNGKAMIYSGDKYNLEKTIDVGADPDNLRYHERSKTVIIGYGEGSTGAFATFNSATGDRVGKDLTIDGHPESFTVEQKGSRIFVNVPTAGAVIERVDRNTGAVDKWPLKGVRGNYAMALNEDDHRVFVCTRKIPMFLAFDTETGKEVARLPSTGSCDDVYYDARRKRVYVLGAEGFISVFQQDSADQYHLLANVPSEIGARTGYLFVQRDRLYIGIPARMNLPAQIWTYEVQD
jgi:DNA-binding beta-propeller fold protein YncE